MKVAIHQNYDIFRHSTLWNQEWISYCEENVIDYAIVNCFDNDILSALEDFDVLLWHFNQYSLQEMLFARIILNSAKKIGIKVFPDFDTAWHFDDKIAETYLLDTINAPIPKSWMFYTKSSAKKFFEDYNHYPIVAKLRCGSGSSNVELLKNKQQAFKYTNKMFRNGFKSAPSIIFKAKSNIKSSSNIDTFVKRFKRIPDFIQSYFKSNQFPNEKGYVFLQEFVPNDGYDLKVVVVGDKLSFLGRDTRKGDFRASGGGSIRYDKELITEEIRNLSFDISDKLGFQSMGFDFVVDNNDQSAKIVEISYGFSHTAQIDLGGYWKKNGEWINEPLNAPLEVIKNLINN